MSFLLFCVIWFGWFNNPAGDTGQPDRLTQIQAQADHANITWSVFWPNEAEWTAAAETGQRVRLMIPDELWWAIPDTDPQRPIDPTTLTMWCRENWCGRTLAEWILLVNRHRDQVASILVCDECDCNSDDGTVTFLRWSSDSCQRTAAKRDRIIALLRAWLPGIPLHVNATAAWVFYFRLAQVYGRDPWAAYGVRIPNVELFSFDCYTRWDACFGQETPETLLNAVKVYAPSTQQFLLLPRAFSGSYLGWNPATSELVVMAWQYYGYAQREPRIVGIDPFLWRGWNGAMNNPDIAREYVTMGQLITGKQAVPPPAPTGVRIVLVEASR